MALVDGDWYFDEESNSYNTLAPILHLWAEKSEDDAHIWYVKAENILVLADYCEELGIQWYDPDPIELSFVDWIREKRNPMTFDQFWP